MILSGFTQEERINNLMNQLGDGTCGSVSICSIYDYFNITVSPNDIFELSRDGNETNEYPVEGSSIIGIALASSINENVRIDVYSNYGTSIDELDLLLEIYEKPISEEIKLKSNIFFHNSITIDEILDKISQNSIPIIQFCRNGDNRKGHSSPLIGENEEGFLLFPVWDADGEITVVKNEFNSTWWDAKSCVFLSNQ